MASTLISNVSLDFFLWVSDATISTCVVDIQGISLSLQGTSCHRRDMSTGCIFRQVYRKFQATSIVIGNQWNRIAITTTWFPNGQIFRFRHSGRTWSDSYTFGWFLARRRSTLQSLSLWFFRCSLWAFWALLRWRKESAIIERQLSAKWLLTRLSRLLCQTE